jgi:hypothetical protein
MWKSFPSSVYTGSLSCNVKLNVPKSSLNCCYNNPFPYQVKSLIAAHGFVDEFADEGFLDRLPIKQNQLELK